jgi:hypothetical protein
MDSYPPHAAPLKNEFGRPTEPFVDWWERVGLATYPGVPSDLAEHWIHEHWGGSPFGGLVAVDFTYHEVTWSLEEWDVVVSGWDNFSHVRSKSILKGKELVTRDRKFVPLAEYMAAHGKWPVRPVVLDNRAGAIAQHPGDDGPLPSTFVLIEGHTRFNIAAYLMGRGELHEPLSLWLMVPGGVGGNCR